MIKYRVNSIANGYTMKAANYLELIKEKVPLWLPIRNCNIFMHAIKPQFLIKWFVENNINVFAPWPGCSPDLNPIENCWLKLKEEVSKRNPTSNESLKSAVLDAWCKILVLSSVRNLLNQCLGAFKQSSKLKVMQLIIDICIFFAFFT